MEKHVFPVIGKRPVIDLLPEDLIKVFKPLWGREMTRKLVQWVNKVIMYVATDDSRVDTDIIDKVKNRLGPQSVKNVGHPAVPWTDLPDLWVKLPRTLVGVSMKLLILTCVRDDAVVRARWDEIDRKQMIWRIPPERLKGWTQGFDVPLSPHAAALLSVASRFDDGSGYLFPSPTSKSGHLSNNAHRLWLHKRGWKDRDGRLATAHGFRASFRTWTDEVRIDRAVAEHCLQHVSAKGGQVERAYARSGRLDERREVLDAWAQFVTQKDIVEAAQRQQQRAMDQIIAAEEGRAMTSEEAVKWGRFDDLEGLE
jgi:integrase